jgi:Zn-dependent alcohol dehydrogenase
MRKAGRRSGRFAIGRTEYCANHAGEKAEVELPRLFAKRARVLTSHGGDHLPQEDFPRLAQWALEGKIDLAGMVTRRVGLDGAQRALDELRSSPDLIRSVIVL